MITGIILAGGKSIRMQEDKALKIHNDQTFIHCIIKVLEKFTNQIIICSDHTSHDQFGYDRIPDTFTDSGPLGGIYAGLEHSKTQKNIIISCDVPFIMPEVISLLLDQDTDKNDALVYRSNPLIGIYNKSVSTTLKAFLENQQLSIYHALSSIDTSFVDHDPSLELFLRNINTPEQYEEAVEHQSHYALDPMMN